MNGKEAVEFILYSLYKENSYFASSAGLKNKHLIIIKFDDFKAFD